MNAQLRWLRNVTQMLASPPSDQAKHLEDLGTAPSTDELALEFSDACALVPELHRHSLVSTEAQEALKRVDDVLGSMSEGPSEVWTIDALTSAQWREVRVRANEALALLQATDAVGS